MPVRSLPGIAMVYIRGNFASDFIPWIPFHYLIDIEAHNELKILFVLKIYRIFVGMEKFNVQDVMQRLRDFQLSWIEKKIA